MFIARVLSKIYKKEDGVILIDYAGQKYICGNPNKEKPIILKFLKKNLDLKLIINPELEFPEAYMRGEIVIENASLKDFLMQFVKNLGRKEVTKAGFVSKKIYQLWRFISNFNLPTQSKKTLNIIMILVVKKEKNFMIYL